MPRYPLSKLGVMAHDKRGARTLREAARDIGVGPATLMRVENGRIPDVATFGKICKWLEIDPGLFLGFGSKHRSEKAKISSAQSPGTVSAHLKADQVPQAETVQALATMILWALKTKPS